MKSENYKGLIDMDMAVILTFHNRKNKTLSCLKSLLHQTYVENGTIQLECYFCDDGSTDGSSEQIRVQYPKVHLTYGDGSLFWAKGMFKSFSKALETKHDFYLMVNDDVDFYPDMIRTMLESYYEVESKAPLVAIVGSTEDSFGGNWTYGGQIWNKQLIHERYVPVLPEKPCRECNMSNWNCFLIPDQMIKNIGSIDDYYEHAKADNDYSNRIILSGNKIYVAHKYIGICQRNSINNTWRDETLSLKKRLEYANKPIGLPIKSELHYCMKFHGVKWPLWVGKRYLWIYLSWIKHVIKERIRYNDGI